VVSREEILGAWKSWELCQELMTWCPRKESIISAAEFALNQTCQDQDLFKERFPIEIIRFSYALSIIRRFSVILNEFLPR
jgi:hypothetical protein